MADGGCCSCCCPPESPDHHANTNTSSSATLSASVLSTAPAQLSISRNPTPTLQEIRSNFETIDIESQAYSFIEAIREVLKTAPRPHDTPSTSSSHTEKLSNWASFIDSGRQFLNFVLNLFGEAKIDTEAIFSESKEATQIVVHILDLISSLHWVVAALSMVGYLVSNCAKVSKNRTECLQLLEEMITLVYHIKDLNKNIQEEREKFENAFRYLMQGSLRCAAILHSGVFYSFLASIPNSEKLTAIRNKIRDLYTDLTLTATRHIIRQMPVSRPLLPQRYPSHAVGIEGQVKAVNELLDMECMEDSSRVAVVICGLGGIGKTTLAKAVVPTVNRDRYNYARIELNLVSERNNYKEKQQQILKDAFPSYQDGKTIELRDDADGRDHLTQAFKSEISKPVFLFIDNVLHMEDLEKILPEDLRGLPHGSRILATTRMLKETDVLEERGIQRKGYPVQPLSGNHALTLLCNDVATRESIKHDLVKIVDLCEGIPLVLEIVAARLRKQGYNAEGCTQIPENLKAGRKIKEKDLSSRLFDFVYSKLEESTQEAFLDICCLLPCWISRQNVSYIVGAEEVENLVDAALITVEEDAFLGEALFVHDIILSIGRSMLKSSRIVDEDSWFEVEKDEGKLKEIKGVFLYSLLLENRHLHSMKDTLRILICSGIDVRTTDTVPLPELRCIIAGGNLSGLNIEELDKLVILWCGKLPIQGRDHLKLPGSLKCIRLGSVEMHALSKIELNSSLEALSIRFSDGDRDSSHEERENNKCIFNRFLLGLNKLKHLELSYCKFLCELPGQICKLPQLSTLHMTNCYKLKCLSEAFGQLTTLKELDLSGCESLEELPQSFGQLTNLFQLDLSGCQSLKELPRTFAQLTSLEELNLIGCESLKEFPLKNLKSLKKIYKSNSHNLGFCNFDARSTHL